MVVGKGDNMAVVDLVDLDKRSGAAFVVDQGVKMEIVVVLVACSHSVIEIHCKEFLVVMVMRKILRVQQTWEILLKTLKLVQISSS